jgi:flagellar motor switch protein FliN
MSEDENENESIEDTDLEDLLSDDDDFQDMLDEEDDLDSDLSDFDEDVDSLDGFTEEDSSFDEEDSLHLTNEETNLESDAQSTESEAPIDDVKAATDPATESDENNLPEALPPLPEEPPKEEALSEDTPKEGISSDIDQTPESKDPSADLDSGVNIPEQEEPSHVEVTASDVDMESLESVDLTLTIELSRIQVPIKKVLEMRPGNLIDMQMPEKGYVDLVISGKKVGQGELVKLGDVMGIRILEMGTKSF